MSDDLLPALGRKQREDLDAGASLGLAPQRGTGLEDDALTRPFDDDERAAILDAMFERVDQVDRVDRVDRVEAAATVSPSPRPSNVVELAARRRGVLIGSVLAVAAAATLVWWVGSGAGPEHELVASVPAYTFTQLGGGIAEQRSEPHEVDAAMPELRLRADSNIDWVLTPAKPTQAPIGVALLARSDAGATLFVPRLEAQISEQGAVRLRGPLDQHVTLAVGHWTLTLFVAGPDELPTDAGIASDDAGPWQNLALRVIIVADE